MNKQTDNKIKKTTNSNKNKSLSIVLIFGAVFVLVLIGLALLFFTSRTKQSNKDYVATSGVEELDQFVYRGAKTVLNSIDFNNFNSNKPLDFIDFNNIADGLKRNTDKLKFLDGPTFTEISPTGKTLSSLFNIKYSAKDILFELEIDLYEKYSDNFDKNEYSGSLDIFAFLEKFSKQNFENDYFINGKVNLKGINGNSLIFNFDLFLNQESIILTINDLENNELFPSENLTEINKLVGQAIEIDRKVILDFFNQNIDSSELNLKNFRNSQEYESLNRIYSQSFTNDEVNLIKTLGPKIKKVILDNMQNATFFTNIEKLNSTELPNSTCYSGELNTGELAEVLKSIILESYNIISSNINNIDNSQGQNKLLEGLERMVASVQLYKLSLTTCHDSKNSFYTGYKIDLSSTSTSEKFEISNFQTSFNSDFNFSMPFSELGFTDELIEFFNQTSQFLNRLN